MSGCCGGGSGPHTRRSRACWELSLRTHGRTDRQTDTQAARPSRSACQGSEPSVNHTRGPAHPESPRQLGQLPPCGSGGEVRQGAGPSPWRRRPGSPAPPACQSPRLPGSAHPESPRQLGQLPPCGSGGEVRQGAGPSPWRRRPGSPAPPACQSPRLRAPPPVSSGIPQARPVPAWPAVDPWCSCVGRGLHVLAPVGVGDTRGLCVCAARPGRAGNSLRYLGLAGNSNHPPVSALNVNVNVCLRQGDGAE